MSSACSLAEPSSSGSSSSGSSSIRGVGAGAASDCTPSVGRDTHKRPPLGGSAVPQGRTQAGRGAAARGQTTARAQQLVVGRRRGAHVVERLKLLDCTTHALELRLLVQQPLEHVLFLGGHIAGVDSASMARTWRR